jgi:hypothetical protein
MSMPGAPQDDQRNAITMALMGIANPPGKGRMPQYPQPLPQNIGQGLSAIGNSLGSMGQPPQQPGAPMSLAPPPQQPQQPPPMAPPQAQPMAPQGPPVGADVAPMPQMPQGPQGLY